MTVEEAAKRMVELAEDPNKCKCARVTYRNNNDGSRDVKLVGDIHCLICHGRGRIARCVDCDGAGMVPGSKVCETCYGNGKVPA